MDQLLPDLPTAFTGAGAIGIGVWFLVSVMRQGSGDRKQYREDIREVRRDYEKEKAEALLQHTKEEAELRGQIAELRRENAAFRSELEGERRARWHAEDAAAEYRRRLGIAKDDDTNRSTGIGT